MLYLDTLTTAGQWIEPRSNSVGRGEDQLTEGTRSIPDGVPDHDRSRVDDTGGSIKPEPECGFDAHDLADLEDGGTGALDHTADDRGGCDRDAGSGVIDRVGTAGPLDGEIVAADVVVEEHEAVR